MAARRFLPRSCFAGWVKGAFLLAALSFAGVPLWAAEIIDDTGTQVRNAQLKMKWDQVAPGKGDPGTVSGTTPVDVRLNLSPWVGRSARIYLVLPVQAGGEVRASWTTRGPLLPGQIRSGDRTLVYSGPITSATLEDTWEVALQADGRQLVRAERIAFHFELEITP